MGDFVRIHFWKYEASGNDFLFIPKAYCQQEIIKRMCDKHYGIGADGVIANDIDEFLYFNCDGSSASICGNGLRCFALHRFRSKGIINGTIKANQSCYEYQINKAKPFEVEVKMTIPIYSEKQCSEIEIDGAVFKSWVVDSGVPHIVLLSDKYVNDEKLEKIGKYLNNSKMFLEGINVDIIECSDRHICKTYERGCGLTLACGSGALACFKVLNDIGCIEDKGKVFFKNGEFLTFKRNDDYISLVGGANFLAEGDYLYE